MFYFYFCWEGIDEAERYFHTTPSCDEVSMNWVLFN